MCIRNPQMQRWSFALLCCLLLLLVACTTGPTVSPTSPSPQTKRVPSPSPPSPSLPLPTSTSPPQPTSIPASPLPTPVTITYTVRPGDTLLGLAQTYGVPIAAIQLSNGMGDSTTLYAGQVLTIPSPTDWQGASPYWIIHIVQAGETLLGIGRQYGLELEALRTANGMSEADVIYVGQEMVLPLDRPLATVTPPPTPSPPPPPPSPTPTAASSAPPSADVAAWPGEVTRFINEVRATHGLPPLAYDERLAAAAQAHANDCSRRGWCSHIGSDGSTAAERIRRAGYEAAFTSECWAWTGTPQNVVEMWMDETPPNDPHRRTLLSETLTEVGVGVAPATWGYYFIADFGRPAATP